MSASDLLVVCTFESGEFSPKLDSLAIKHQGELAGWGGGGKWEIDRAYSFRTKKNISEFQKELSTKFPGVQTFIQE